MYFCRICKREYTSEDGLKRHTKFFHGSAGHKCKLCGLIFDRKFRLEDHMRIHTGERPYQCKNCPKSFPSKIYLRTHSKTQLGDVARVHKCAICSKGILPNAHLKQHMNNCHVISETRPFCCEKCGKKFKRIDHLQQHRKTHSSVKPHKCTICSFKTNYKSALQLHVQVRHTKNNPVKCGHCGKMYNNQSTLRQHVSKTHRPEGAKRPNYSCLFCGKGCQTITILYAHILTHIQEKPFRCELCGSEFNSNSGKYLHIRRFHTNERPHSCQFCGKLFISQSELKTHLVYHTQPEKKHQCQICAKKFRTRHTLRRHQMCIHPIATGVTGESCLFCDKVYYDTYLFFIHIRVHLNEKPERCEICEAEFSSSSEKYVHIRRRHERSDNLN